MLQKKYVLLGLGFIILLGFSWNILYFGMSIFHPDFYASYILVLLLSLIILLYVKSKIPKEEKYGYSEFSGGFSDSFEGFTSLRKVLKYKPFLISFIFFLLSFCSFTIYPFLTSAPIFGNAEKYRDLIGKVQEEDFKSARLKVSLAHIRIIDEKTAEVLGEKKLGEDLGLGSRVEIGKYNIQKVNNELFLGSSVRI